MAGSGTQWTSEQRAHASKGTIASLSRLVRAAWWAGGLTGRVTPSCYHSTPYTPHTQGVVCKVVEHQAPAEYWCIGSVALAGTQVGMALQTWSD